MKHTILKTIKLILKTIKNPKDFLLNFEIFKISGIKRYKKFHTKLLGKDIVAVDSNSFLSAYKEIFINNIYKFKTDLRDPRIIDCGANIGLSVIYFKKLFPNSKITTFEPDEKVFETLKHNLFSFGFEDIEIIKKGLSNEEGEINFFSEGSDGGRIATEKDDKNISKINTTRLVNYLKEPVDLLKIDIEGAEYDVLQDSKEYLKNVKNLFIEFHSFKNQEQKLDEIIKIIKETGFRYYITQSGTLLKSPFIEKKGNLSMDLQLNIFAYRN